MDWNAELKAIDDALNILLSARYQSSDLSVRSAEKYLEARRSSVAAMATRSEAMGLCCGLAYVTDFMRHHPDCETWRNPYCDNCLTPMSEGNWDTVFVGDAAYYYCSDACRQSDRHRREGDSK